MKQDNNIARSTFFLFCSISYLFFLYLLFFALGCGLLYISWVMFKYKLTYGYVQYDLPAILPVILFLGAIVLFCQMLDSLISTKKIDRPDLREITREEYPELFELIEEAAATAQVASPGRVYLSATVSAAVFLVPGLLNMFKPDRKQLEIGLGLINVLNREELRAVLSHELGHFSQKTLGLKVPVYIMSQSVRYVVEKVEIKKRGAIEAQYYVFIYIFRMLCELFFLKLNKEFDHFITELEYDADAISIKNNGSQPLVSALYKITFANQLYDFTVESLCILAQNNKKVGDLYVVQLLVIHLFLQHKNSYWCDDLISKPLPETNLSILTQKRIKRALLKCKSEDLTKTFSPASELIDCFGKESLWFTEQMYLYQVGDRTSELNVCSIDAYRKWITKFFQQTEDFTITIKQDVEVKIVMERLITFEAYWDERRLGWYNRRKHITTRTECGIHSLKIKGDRFHESIFEIDTTRKGKYVIYLDAKLGFRGFRYDILLSNISYEH